MSRLTQTQRILLFDKMKKLDDKLGIDFGKMIGQPSTKTQVSRQLQDVISRLRQTWTDPQTRSAAIKAVKESAGQSGLTTKILTTYCREVGLIAQTKADNQIAFEKAVIESDKDLIAHYVQMGGVDINAPLKTGDARGYTPLTWAVHFNDQELVKTLVAAGANITKPDRHGYDALQRSLHHKNEMIPLLLNILLPQASAKQCKALAGSWLGSIWSELNPAVQKQVLKKLETVLDAPQLLPLALTAKQWGIAWTAMASLTDKQLLSGHGDYLTILQATLPNHIKIELVTRLVAMGTRIPRGRTAEYSTMIRRWHLEAATLRRLDLVKILDQVPQDLTAVAKAAHAAGKNGHMATANHLWDRALPLIKHAHLQSPEQFQELIADVLQGESMPSAACSRQLAIRMAEYLALPCNFHDTPQCIPIFQSTIGLLSSDDRRALQRELLMKLGDPNLRDNVERNFHLALVNILIDAEIKAEDWAEAVIISKSLVLGDRSKLGLAIFVASKAGDIDFARWLIKTQRLDPNQRSGLGYTPLMEASHAGSLEMVQFLLEQGGNPILPDRQGMTTVDWAFKHGNMPIFTALVAKMSSQEIAAAVKTHSVLFEASMVTALSSLEAPTVGSAPPALSPAMIQLKVGETNIPANYDLLSTHSATFRAHESWWEWDNETWVLPKDINPQALATVIRFLGGDTAALDLFKPDANLSSMPKAAQEERAKQREQIGLVMNWLQLDLYKPERSKVNQGAIKKGDFVIVTTPLKQGPFASLYEMAHDQPDSATANVGLIAGSGAGLGVPLDALMPGGALDAHIQVLRTIPHPLFANLKRGDTVDLRKLDPPPDPGTVRALLRLLYTHDASSIEDIAEAAEVYRLCEQLGIQDRLPAVGTRYVELYASQAVLQTPPNMVGKRLRVGQLNLGAVVWAKDDKERDLQLRSILSVIDPANVPRILLVLQTGTTGLSHKDLKTIEEYFPKLAARLGPDAARPHKK